mgnify:FL=1
MINTPDTTDSFFAIDPLTKQPFPARTLIPNTRQTAAVRGKLIEMLSAVEIHADFCTRVMSADALNPLKTYSIGGVWFDGQSQPEISKLAEQLEFLFGDCGRVISVTYEQSTLSKSYRVFAVLQLNPVLLVGFDRWLQLV